MKRFFAVLLTLSLLLAACGSTAPEAADVQEANPLPETTEAPEAPATRLVLHTMTMDMVVAGMTVSTKTEHVYDEQGLLFEIISYSGDAETSRTAVETDAHGEVVRQSAVSGNTTTLTELENTYDGAGNLVKKVDTVSVDGTVTDIREYTYLPGAKVQEVRFTGLGGTASGQRYEYDENGLQTAVSYLSGDGAEQARQEITYNEAGDPIRSVTTNSDGVVTAETEYIYLEDGTVKAVSGQGWTLSTYGEQGELLLMESYSSDGQLIQRIENTFITVPAFK